MAEKSGGNAIPKSDQRDERVYGPRQKTVVVRGMYVGDDDEGEVTQVQAQATIPEGSGKQVE